MKTVSEHRNYSIRVEKQGGDEIGQLFDGFNDMLAQIQQRDSRLERYAAELEEKNEELKGFIFSAAHDLRAPLVATLQAGRGRLAVGWYAASENGWQAQGPAKVETVDSLAEQIQNPTIVCGELSAEERQRLARKRVNVVLMTAANSVRRPAILAELAWARWQAGKVDDLSSLAPIYLHAAEPIPG
jgi:signal transduction histidine kinase